MDTVISSHSPSSSQDLHISPEQLTARMGRSSSPLILDVRREAKFLASDHLIAGAIRCAPEDVEAFARLQSAREVVVYCVYGHNVSHDATMTLRQAGWAAQALAGGIEGGEQGVDSEAARALWQENAAPRIRKRADLGVTGERASRWVTRERPKIDRIACPWLIRRFMDPRAEFFYVPDDQVLSQVKALEAVAYDIPNALITHRDEFCSFDALLAAVDLQMPALDLLARIVRGADTGNLQLERSCAGLLAITQGMARLYPKDDQAMLAAMLPIYDALYAWCIDAVAGNIEPHVWRTPPPPNDAQLRRQAEFSRRTL